MLQRLTLNAITIHLQEVTSTIVEETAAISCSYSGFSNAYDSYLKEPNLADCRFGYRPAAGEENNQEFKIPAALQNTKPNFPADLEIYKLTNIGGQNTSAIGTKLPIMAGINTQNCHTAELRIFSAGEWQTYTLHRNSKDFYFDAQTTDYESALGRYFVDTYSGFYKTITKREPVEVVYQCDWRAPRVVYDAQIAGLNQIIKNRLNRDASWEVTISDGDETLQEFTAANSTDFYRTLRSMEGDTWGAEYEIRLRVKDATGAVLATNYADGLAEDQRERWTRECEDVDQNLAFEYGSDEMNFRLCDLSDAFLDSGVKTDSLPASDMATEYLAPIKCQVTKFDTAYGWDLATSSASRTSCEFSYSEQTLTLPDGEHLIGYPDMEAEDIMFEVAENDVEIDGIADQKILLKLDEVKKFGFFARRHCDAASIRFVDLEGTRQRLALNTMTGLASGRLLKFQRSSDMAVATEESFGDALKALAEHNGNTADYNLKVDIYVFCKWWAMPGETVILP